MLAPPLGSSSPFAGPSIGRCALLVAAATLATAVGAQTSRERRPDLIAVAPQVIEQTNTLRSRHGIEPVVSSTPLAEAAQAFAEFMAATDRYGHEADDRKPTDRAQAQGYEPCVVAENLAYTFNSAGFTTEALALRLVEGWTRSPEHRKNMLLAAATDIGIGVAQSPRTQRYYAVQLLGRPRSAATKFEVANRAGIDIRYEIDGEVFNLPVLVTRTHTRCTDGTLRLLTSESADGVALRLRDGARYLATRDPAGQIRLQPE
jgi:uncharacterized protein YkwD